MNAKAARNTIDLLIKLAKSPDLSPFADDRIQTAANHLKIVTDEPVRFAAYHSVLVQHQYTPLLFKAVQNGLKLLLKQLDALDTEVCETVVELCNTLGVVLVTSRGRALQHPAGFRWQDAIRTLDSTGMCQQCSSRVQSRNSTSQYSSTLDFR